MISKPIKPMRITFIILTIIFICGFTNQKTEIEIPEDDWNQAKAAFNELNEALKNENGQLWNHSLNGPLMLVNRVTRTIITNESSDGLVKRESLFIGQLPENIIIANTAFEWNGKRWTMVALPLPDTKEERLDLLIHESFHRIQPEIGFDSLHQIQNIHLDLKDGRIYLKLELEALKKALQSDKPDIQIKNALLFRKYRHHLFPESKNSENSLEINEGIAEYTGSILSQREDSKLKEHYISRIDGLYSVPTFVRSFAYFTIPVYGYFMQKKDPKWNLSITKGSNLTDFISEFWNVNQRKLSKEDILKIGKEYNIDSIIKTETQREIKNEELKSNYRKTFLSDSIVEIDLKNISIGFDPTNLMPLDSLGTVYPNLRLTDNWGVLKVDSCGALISPQWNKVSITYPLLINDTLVIGRGWELKLNNSWKLEKIGSKYKVTK